MIGFIIGLIIGATLGYLICAVFVIGKLGEQKN